MRSPILRRSTASYQVQRLRRVLKAALLQQELPEGALEAVPQG
jgi:hypothetical protein